MKTRMLLSSVLLATAMVVPAARGEVDVHVNLGLPPPIAVQGPPPFVVVPGYPDVSYVPSIDVDLFSYGGHYYRYYNGGWFSGPAYGGPWVHVAAPPRRLLDVPVRYYRVPPRRVYYPRHGHHVRYYHRGHDDGHGHGHHHGDDHHDHH